VTIVAFSVAAMITAAALRNSAAFLSLTLRLTFRFNLTFASYFFGLLASLASRCRMRLVPYPGSGYMNAKELSIAVLTIGAGLLNAIWKRRIGEWRICEYDVLFVAHSFAFPILDSFALSALFIKARSLRNWTAILSLGAGYLLFHLV